MIGYKMLGAPSQIGHEHYTYDANGNPTRVENDSTAAVREMYWDEDNRLMVLSDNGKTSRYTYNHAGERAVKSHGSMEGVYINGAPQGITFHETDEYTLYPASIISVNKNRFTKHYFIGDKRVASRIGSGSFNNVYGQNGSFLTAGQQDYAERLNQIETQREDYYRELGIAPGIPTMKGSYGDPENTGIGYNTIIKELGDHTVPAEWAQYVKHNEVEGSTPGAPILWDDPSDPETAQPGYGFIADNSGETEETFYYHSDHLGSTSYITDGNGNITQYDAYLPYGELLVDEHSSSEEMPYKFNGKELDEETGLYYYGARYMQPVASIWYGVDPLAEKYAEISGYVYCHANPVRMIDNDDKEPGDFFWTMDKAAIDFGMMYNDNSIRQDREYLSQIIRVKNNSGQWGYTYTLPSIGGPHSVSGYNFPFGGIFVGDIHSHGAFSEEYRDNEFSGVRDENQQSHATDCKYLQKVKDGDIGDANKEGITSYLVSPNGTLQKYESKSGKISIIDQNMPSDANDPERVNVKSVNETKSVSLRDNLNYKKNIEDLINNSRY